MKKKMIWKGLLFSLVCTMVFVACKKDRTVLIIDANNTKSYTLDAVNMWSDLAPAKQLFTVNATTGGMINGVKGCKFYIYPNTLEDASGNLATGDVDVELIEYMSKADMIFSGITTVSDNNTLESGGMFYMNIKKGNTQLRMRAGKPVFFNILQANNTDDAMDIFNAVPNLNGDKNKLNWKRKDSVQVKPQRDSAGTKGKGYFNLNYNYFEFGYCNIDRYWDKFLNKIKKFRIKMPKGCNDTNSTALLMFKNYNCCAWCHWMSSEDRISTNYALPLGETIKVLVYKKTGAGADDLAYNVMEVTLSDDTEVVFDDAMIKCNKSQLADIIKAL